MCITATYVRAAVQRAQIEGEVNVTLNVKDMLEILPYIDAGINKERVLSPMKPVGWLSPHDLRNLWRGKGDHIRLSRKKSPERCMQVYRCDDLAQMEALSVQMVAERIHAQREKAMKEAGHVPSSLS